MVRGPFFDKNGIKKGAWSEEEDEILRSYIHKCGHTNWRQLPKFAGLARCGKSCRLRWMNYLRPNLKHGNYTQEEEEIIIKLHEQLGNKWSLIAEKVPGRTDNEIKNHWHSQLKKRSKRKYKEIRKPSDSNSEHPESDILNVAAESHSILESSMVVSTEEDNSVSLASNDVESSMNWSREEDSVAPRETTYQELSCDFWTQPFISENTYTEAYEREGIYSYDGTELLYQVIAELPIH